MPSWHDKQPSPKHGDTIQCGPLSLWVGCHNGDFRSIVIYDHLGRPIASGDVPYRALREIQDAT